MGSKKSPASILVVDIGGSKVKALVSGETEPRRALSGPQFTPEKMVETVRELAKGWEYDAITIGIPGRTGGSGLLSEPGNLGPGWVGFNFAAAFEKPVRIMNDAAMQALGCYQRGRMLFLGLGTGLGSAMIADHTILSMELGRLRTKNGQRLWRILGEAGRRKLGNREWRREVLRSVADFQVAFQVHDVVIGGGNAKLFKEPPPGARLGNNRAAFAGGFRVWQIGDIQTHDGTEAPAPKASEPLEWRLV